MRSSPILVFMHDRTSEERLRAVHDSTSWVKQRRHIPANTTIMETIPECRLTPRPKQSEEGSTAGYADFGDNIDATTFEQILEMDDDEDEREFSKSIVYDFFQQAESTFVKMDTNL